MDVTCSWMKILLFMFLYVTVDAEQVDECVKLTSCSCRNSEGIIDLSPLASTDYTAKFKAVPDEAGSYYYYYNPCYSFTEIRCTAVSGCKTNMINSYSLGKQDSAAFKVDDTNGLYIEYESLTDVERTLQVYLKCDQGEEGKLDVKGESPPGSGIYEMTLTSKHCCTKSPGPNPDPCKHSHREWLIIIILSCIMVSLLVLIILSSIIICLQTRNNRNTSLTTTIPNPKVSEKKSYGTLN